MSSFGFVNKWHRGLSFMTEGFSFWISGQVWPGTCVTRLASKIKLMSKSPEFLILSFFDFSLVRLQKILFPLVAASMIEDSHLMQIESALVLYQGCLLSEGIVMEQLTGQYFQMLQQNSHDTPPAESLSYPYSVPVSSNSWLLVLISTTYDCEPCSWEQFDQLYRVSECNIWQCLSQGLDLNVYCKRVSSSIKSIRIQIFHIFNFGHITTRSWLRLKDWGRMAYLWHTKIFVL